MAVTRAQSQSFTLVALDRVETSFNAAIAAIIAPLRQRAEYNRVYNELARCSDRDLADIGIARSDIPRIAREGSRG